MTSLEVDHRCGGSLPIGIQMILIRLSLGHPASFAARSVQDVPLPRRQVCRAAAQDGLLLRARRLWFCDSGVTCAELSGAFITLGGNGRFSLDGWMLLGLLHPH